MNSFEHNAVVVHFLSGKRVEIYVVDRISPPNSDDGDAEHFQSILR